jgi:hypothetical protein
VDFLAKPLANNDVALMMTNFADAAAAVTASITIDEIINGTSQWNVGIGSQMVDKNAFAAADYYELYDIGARGKTSVVLAKNTPISVALPGHVSKTYRIKPFKPGNGFITLAREASGDITANFGVNNNTGYQAYAALAVYDDNMVLQSVTPELITVTAPYYYNTKTISPPSTLWTVKAFLWEANTFAPLSVVTERQMPGADKSSLRTGINRASAMDLDRYTRLTADKLATALAAAKAVDSEKNPSQQSVDAAASALNAAIDGLVQAASTFVFNGESYVRLTGRFYGQTGSWSNAGNTFDKMFDGDINSFYDAVNAGDGYGGIDLGVGNESNVDLIRFYPRPDSYYTRANSCTFRGSNTISTGGNTGTLLYTISGVTSAQWYNVTTISSTEKFRYIWFMSGASSQGNIAEVEFYVKGIAEVDRSLLNDRISYAGTLVAADYTPGSWSVMRSALTNATSLPADASQAQVDSAAKNLKAALNGLIRDVIIVP